MGLRSAIDEKCKDCIYDPAIPGRWREQVEACTCTDCPLHPYRPRSNKKKEAQEETQEIIIAHGVYT